jgi:hypothetical protein
MITLIQSMPIGNALRIFISPPAGAEHWRVLRRTADAFTGPDDAGAVEAHDGTDEVFLDVTALVNGTQYYYKAFWWNGAEYVDGGAAVAATPEATMEDASVDVLDLLRDRLKAGLAVEVAKNRLVHEHGSIECHSGPARYEDTVLPVVTIQLTEDKPTERSIGEQILPDKRVESGYLEHEGWHSLVQIEVVGWSFNPEERNELRRALKRIVIGNLPIFEAAGCLRIEFTQRDTEDYESFNALVYQTWGTFQCLAPSLVSGEVGEVNDVITEITWE